MKLRQNAEELQPGTGGGQEERHFQVGCSFSDEEAVTLTKSNYVPTQIRSSEIDARGAPVSKHVLLTLDTELSYPTTSPSITPAPSGSKKSKGLHAAL